MIFTKTLVSALPINKGGGEIYLKLCINKYDKNDTTIYLDERIKHLKSEFRKSRVLIFKYNIFSQFIILNHRIYSYFKSFYDKKKNSNLTLIEEYWLNGRPPLIRLPFCKSKIFILMQNKLILDKSCDWELKIIQKLKLLLLRFLFFRFLRKRDTVIVQTQSMYKFIKNNYPEINNILIEDNPWKAYDNINKSKEINDKNEKKLYSLIREQSFNKLIYFYPSSNLVHKNNITLLNAFEQFNSKNNNQSLLVITINNNFLVPYHSAFFTGHISHSMVCKIYKLTNYLIFPSLIESLGLPLIEAKNLNIPILSSKLPYVEEVCKPFISFDPNSSQSIERSLLQSYLKFKGFTEINK